MDYKHELERFVNVSRQMVDNANDTIDSNGVIVRSYAAWAAFVNGLNFCEKNFQQGESANSPASPVQQTKVPISDLADEFIDTTDLSSVEESGVNQFVTWIGQKQ